jgi:hypothetical protein
VADRRHYHFHGSFRNAGDVITVLDVMAQEPAYADWLRRAGFILDLFEATFNHRAFTGRSGTFFAFEGLGSIYWHMVAKLLLAVQECYETALAMDALSRRPLPDLAAAYYDIRQGLGFNKSPAIYGAFPADPYSHTPAGSGARQPGMTGQVKEEILTRWGELGVSIQDGALHFEPTLLRQAEFLATPDTFRYWDVGGEQQTLPVDAGSLAFTLCQTPVIYTRGDRAEIEVTYADGQTENVDGNRLGHTISREIFERDNRIRLLRITLV